MQMRTEQLSGLADAGVEALGYISAGTRAPTGWKSSKTELLAAAKQPGGIVRFTILDSLAELIAAVQEQP